jgi:hypothetical protein
MDRPGNGQMRRPGMQRRAAKRSRFARD